MLHHITKSTQNLSKTQNITLTFYGAYKNIFYNRNYQQVQIFPSLKFRTYLYRFTVQ